MICLKSRLLMILHVWRDNNRGPGGHGTRVQLHRSWAIEAVPTARDHAACACHEALGQPKVQGTIRRGHEAALVTRDQTSMLSRAKPVSKHAGERNGQQYEPPPSIRCLTAFGTHSGCFLEAVKWHYHLYRSGVIHAVGLHDRLRAWAILPAKSFGLYVIQAARDSR